MHSDNLHQRADPDADTARYGVSAVKPTLAVIGAGKVGTVLARLLFEHGYTITTVYSRSHDHAEALASIIQAQMVETLSEVSADLVLLTVPDDAIRATASALVGFSGRAVIHTSGAHDARALDILGQAGIQVGSLHPAYPFAGVDSAIKGLTGATFAVEAENEPLRSWLRDMVAALGGSVLLIPLGGKALYHAALVFASNYTVTLYGLAEALLTSLGADKPTADHALNALVAGTVENLRVNGLPAALTGPLVRADMGTIAAHLQALQSVDENLVDVYRQLARLTYPLLQARGIAPDEIERVLGQDVDDAHHSP